MTTATVDDRKRLRISAAKPGQVFAITGQADGTFTLTPVKAEAKEPFPPGSLVKYFSGPLGKEANPLHRFVNPPIQT